MSQLDLLSIQRPPSPADAIPEGDGAVFSPDGKYRYVLTRGTGKRATWCLLNPSVAAEIKGDPTERKVKGFTRVLGEYTGCVITNPFALVATKSKVLSDTLRADPAAAIGPDNDLWLERVFRASDGKVIVGWGSRLGDRIESRVLAILKIAAAAGVELYSFGVTQDGHPQHPLMTAYAVPLSRWSPP